MFIREICGKITSFLISLGSQKFQKIDLGKFIPNFPLKNVITSTNVTSISNLLGLSSIEYAMAYMLMQML